MFPTLMMKAPNILAEVVAIKVIGGYVHGELDPPGVHKVVKLVGYQVEEGEVQDQSMLCGLAINCIGSEPGDI
jgi:hypothetical protein